MKDYISLLEQMRKEMITKKTYFEPWQIHNQFLHVIVTSEKEHNSSNEKHKLSISFNERSVSIMR